MATVVKPLCGRCPDGKEELATETVRFNVEDTWYELPVCDAHQTMFSREMFAWTRYADVTDGPAQLRAVRTFTPDRVAREREAAQIRDRIADAQRFAKAQLRAAEIDEQNAADARRRTVNAQRDYELSIRKSIPGAMKWRLTSHARDRADERNVDLYKVFQAAAHPGERRPQPWRGPHIYVHQRDEARVIVNENTGAIITVVDPYAPEETPESFAAARASHSERVAL